MNGLARLLAGMVVVLGLAGGPQRSGAETPDARAELEEFADKLKIFPPHGVAANQPDTRDLPGDLREPYRKFLERIAERKYEVKSLVDLLQHKNPRVRTLALAALFAREDPKLLPHIAPLVTDKAETFPAPELIAAPAFAPKVEPPLRKQTVGEIARDLLLVYLGPAGLPGFDDYWAKHKDRTFCAGWFAVQLYRAAGGRSPTPRDRLDAVREVRQRIDQLPKADRAWTLLWLSDRPGTDVLATEEELVEACKQLGPDNLVKMLQRRIPSDDPDVQPRASNNGPHARMVRFVLHHAPSLLRPEDAEALVACERWERDYQKHDIVDPTILPDWAIAAAQLQPEKARPILKDAWDRFQGKYSFDADHRAALALAWWQRAAGEDPSFVVKWFYEETPQRGQFPHCRAWLLQQIGKRQEPQDRKLIAALIWDKGFDTLDWQSLTEVVRVVNGWGGRPVVAADELRDAWHPSGMGHFHWQQDQARKDYPRETEQLLDQLRRWREALRARVPRP
jgi:hypothetical protein